jgi:hypothetical protein
MVLAQANQEVIKSGTAGGDHKPGDSAAYLRFDQSAEGGNAGPSESNSRGAS